MDVNTLLEFVEELLIMYGYECRRNVGIVGGNIKTARLEKETGRLEEVIPQKEEQGIVYRADILAEKKGIERPFGRIVVMYKRGHDPVTVADVEHAAQIRGPADAHSVLFVTTSGFKPDVPASCVPLNVTILTPEKVQTLLGKAMTKEKWWFGAPAYPVAYGYESVKFKLKWLFEKMLFINFSCIWFAHKELVYEPYWKFSYHVTKGGEMKTDTFSLNAFTGGIDSWFDINPKMAKAVEGFKSFGKKTWFEQNIINVLEKCHMTARSKIQKPKLPKGVNYLVHRPTMEKHEAKLAAMQWAAYAEDIEPDEVIITSIELVYIPWWQFFYLYTPIIKNAWGDTEYFGFKISAVYGDVFNQWEIYQYKRDIIYYYMEKSLIKLFGRDRYVNFMRKVTLGVSVLWWNYSLVIKPTYIWILLLLITIGTIYAFVSATWGLSLILGLLLVFIFMGPGYAFLYVLQEHLKRYPVHNYPHPGITEKKYKREIKPIEEKGEALAQLEKMAKEGKLTEAEERELDHVRKAKVSELVKKATGGKKWWKFWR